MCAIALGLSVQYHSRNDDEGGTGKFKRWF